MSDSLQGVSAVVLAGGRGTRLHPYTYVLPKPLVPVGSKPIISHLLHGLRRHGVERAIITLGYASSLIRTFCMEEFAELMKLEFSVEEKPLGTIGPLALLRDRLTGTFLVTNGDLVTDLDFRRLLRHHRRSGCLMTVGAYRQEVKSKYGELKVQGGRLKAFREKPVHRSLTNMGVYVFEPGIFEHIPTGIAFGVDNLLSILEDRGVAVNVYQHKGLWTDIGSIPDLQAAQEVFEKFRDRISGD